jgi:hypothetical protein
MNKKERRAWDIQWAMADIERLRMGGYDTFTARGEIRVRKIKGMPQEKGLYRKIVDSWDSRARFAVQTYLRIEKNQITAKKKPGHCTRKKILTEKEKPRDDSQEMLPFLDEKGRK